MLPALAVGCGAPERKPVALLTALPMIWGEGDVYSIVGDGGRSSISYKWLAEHYSVTPLDAVDDAMLKPHRLMIVAQPRALAPTELVAIDAWVRGGGRALILTDPWLDWPSRLAIGDPRRAPVLGLLDPLLTHWGLVLEAPRDGDGGLVERQGLRTVAPGWLRATGKSCSIEEDELIAVCAIGAGRALVVADADLLADTHWEGNSAVVAGWLERLAR